jgi:hypothetical protein
MESKWQRRRILIWGKTRPDLSKKYREIVCTGGVLEDTRRLVRLYPIPLRYMDDKLYFKKYQWIEADITKPSADPRPESYRINPDGIKILGEIPTHAGNWDARAEWIMQEGNVFQSVEALQERQKIDHTSLGLVKPLVVIDVRAQRYDEKERAEFWEKYNDAVRQMDLPLDPDTGREIRPLRPPDYRFIIQFRCDDERCEHGHNFSVLDWEIDALYFNLRQQGDAPHVAVRKVIDKLQNQVCASDKDLYLFLGNIATHPHIFTIVGLWYPKNKQDIGQLRLL